MTDRELVENQCKKAEQCLARGNIEGAYTAYQYVLSLQLDLEQWKFQNSSDYQLGGPVFGSGLDERIAAIGAAIRRSQCSDGY